MFSDLTMTDAFAKRFEAAGDGYVFRKRPGAPGYAVSKAERDGFVLEFERRSPRMMIGFFIVMTATPFVIALLKANPWMSGLVASAVLIAGQTVVSRQCWDKPLRALRNRAPISET